MKIFFTVVVSYRQFLQDSQNSSNIEKLILFKFHSDTNDLWVYAYKWFSEISEIKLWEQKVMKTKGGDWIYCIDYGYTFVSKKLTRERDH